MHTLLLAGLGAGPDPRGMTCEAIIKGYEKNTLLASPEGGRSAKHRKNSAVRVKELQPFYDKCIGGTAAPGAIAEEDQAVIDQLYDGGSTRLPPAMSGAVRYRQPAGIGTGTLIALAVGGGLLLTFLLVRKK